MKKIRKIRELKSKVKIIGEDEEEKEDDLEEIVEDDAELVNTADESTLSHVSASPVLSGSEIKMVSDGADEKGSSAGVRKNEEEIGTRLYDTAAGRDNGRSYSSENGGMGDTGGIVAGHRIVSRQGKAGITGGSTIENAGSGGRVIIPMDANQFREKAVGLQDDSGERYKDERQAKGLHVKRRRELY